MVYRTTLVNNEIEKIHNLAVTQYNTKKLLIMNYHVRNINLELLKNNLMSCCHLIDIYDKIENRQYDGYELMRIVLLSKYLYFMLCKEN